MRSLRCGSTGGKIPKYSQKKWNWGRLARLKPALAWLELLLPFPGISSLKIPPKSKVTQDFCARWVGRNWYSMEMPQKWGNGRKKTLLREKNPGVFMGGKTHV